MSSSAKLLRFVLLAGGCGNHMPVFCRGVSDSHRRDLRSVAFQSRILHHGAPRPFPQVRPSSATVPYIRSCTPTCNNALSLLLENKSLRSRIKTLNPIPARRLPTSLLSSPLINDWTPLYLSSIAGASTCIGAAIVFLFPKQEDGVRQISPETMAFSLALAGSVMITVSAISIGPECLLDLTYQSDIDGATRMIPLASTQFLQRVVSFLLGCLLYYGLSYFAFPEPDELLGYDTADIQERATSTQLALSTTATELEIAKEYAISSLPDRFGGTHLMTSDQQRAWRVAMLLFISLLFHNFPEGLAVAASALESDKLGLAVTIGIMIHNIPEGIAIAVPCLAARPESPWLAFVMASLSGLAEPLGALLTIIFLRGSAGLDDVSFLNMQNTLALVCGIMVTVALNELLPEARNQIAKSDSRFMYYAGLLTGAIVMFVTEIVLKV